MTVLSRPAFRVAIATPPRLLADTLAGPLGDNVEVAVLDEVEADDDRGFDVAVTVGSGPVPVRSAPMVLVLDDADGSRGGGTVRWPGGVAIVELEDLGEAIRPVHRLVAVRPVGNGGQAQHEAAAGT